VNDSALEVPAGVVTVTLTEPALPAGLVTVTCVPVSPETLTAVPPKLTLVAPARLVPVSVTVVPPPVDPLAGFIPVSTGGGTTYVNDSALEVPAGVVTVTLTGPGSPGGLVTVTCVPVSPLIVTGVLPKLTPVAPVRSVPVIVTGVPPAVGPLAGAIPVSAGGGR